jgi:type II secretory ATPase GspE/PulE/Tfp pilus assembly ATPase PilB-like protein
MATVLNKDSLGKGKALNLNTISATKARRILRTREDLDKQFIESETRQRSAYMGLPYIDLYGFPIDTGHLNVVSKDMVIKAKMGPFTINNKEVYLATYNLGADFQQEIFQHLHSLGLTYKIFICSKLSFDKLINTYNNLVEVKKIDENISISESVFDKQSIDFDFKSIADKIMMGSTSQKIEIILSSALQNKASDIHFEPEKENYLLRLRIDGVLHTIAKLPVTDRPSIESRIKLLSGLKLNVDNIAQDGRFSFRYNEKDIDVRVSMLPSNYGYSVVMRLLGTGNVALDLDSLGFSEEAKELVLDAINKPQGMILTTGPTGSGKTTTLYTFLSHLNNGETKIITLEDPIEYKLSGISQTQIDSAAGYTFGSGLRSILRQDPDIVMVGEIRDPETADIAIQASLTGHLMLSTLHTNDAAGAIPRLMEMGIKGFLLSDSLSILIAQRLVRKICTFCIKDDILDSVTLSKIKAEIDSLPDKTRQRLGNNFSFKTSTGCEKCNNLGYKGRIGVYEIITVTTGLRNLLANQYPSIAQVRQTAIAEGMISMRQDAIIKALNGITDIKEINRTVV